MSLLSSGPWQPAIGLRYSASRPSSAVQARTARDCMSKMQILDSPVREVLRRVVLRIRAAAKCQPAATRMATEAIRSAERRLAAPRRFPVATHPQGAPPRAVAPVPRAAAGAPRAEERRSAGLRLAGARPVVPRRAEPSRCAPTALGTSCLPTHFHRTSRVRSAATQPRRALPMPELPTISGRKNWSRPTGLADFDACDGPTMKPAGWTPLSPKGSATE